MKPPPQPTHEWRLNERLSSVFPEDKYYDLHVGNVYQNVWIRETAGRFCLASYKHDNLGDFDSIQDAEDHLIVLNVVERFERAYG